VEKVWSGCRGKFGGVIGMNEVVRDQNHANLRKRMLNTEMFLLAQSEYVSGEMKLLIGSVLQKKMVRGK